MGGRKKGINMRGLAGSMGKKKKRRVTTKKKVRARRELYLYHPMRRGGREGARI